MPKTIFSKLVIIFIAILIIGFSITGTMLYLFLGNFVSQEKVKLLQQSGERINTLLALYIENGENPLMGRVLKNVLNSYSENTNSIIWIVTTNGEVVIADESIIPYQVLERLRNETGRLRLPDSRQYKKITDETGDEVLKGDFYGLFADTGVSWLTVIKPFKYIGEDNREKVLGAVYLNTQIPEVKRAQATVFKYFMFAVGVSIIISVILVYIFSLRISKPLKEINTAAKIIANGEFTKRLVINTRDEIGELVESFNNMAYALQNLEEMRRNFIANVSHELRTPMTSIRGFIDGILDGTIPNEKHNEYLNIVSEEAGRLNRLVNDLLDLARMESGEMTFKSKEFNINELLRRCIIKFENFILAKNIQIEASLEEEEIFVYADIDGIERVIINLIHNAIKFTPENGKIIIQVTRHKGKVLIVIQDNGVGIEENEINQIWERFYKSDKSRGKDKGGAGLGLAIVKNIINEHNESIWVESKLGLGTKFIFTLTSNDY